MQLGNLLAGYSNTDFDSQRQGLLQGLDDTARSVLQREVICSWRLGNDHTSCRFC